MQARRKHADLASKNESFKMRRSDWNKDLKLDMLGSPDRLADVESVAPRCASGKVFSSGPFYYINLLNSTIIVVAHLYHVLLANRK